MSKSSDLLDLESVCCPVTECMSSVVSDYLYTVCSSDGGMIVEG